MVAGVWWSMTVTAKCRFLGSGGWLNLITVTVVSVVLVNEGYLLVVVGSSW